MKMIVPCFSLFLIVSCAASLDDPASPEQAVVAAPKDSSVVVKNESDEARATAMDSMVPLKNVVIDTKKNNPQEVVAYAQTLLGTPYKYASVDPAVGFDCSGFITYVFSHFNIAVPRSSIDFTNAGTPVDLAAAKQGDLILFTGTDSTQRFVGHMGIIMENTDSVRFIHSSSGKAKGVTITAMNKYYTGRYVKTIRIFPQNK